MKVSNRVCIRNLSIKSMKAARARNLVAIIAIMLTSILFTTVFTIAMSINDSFQQANFRQVGGYAHGGFKYLSEEQYDEIENDPLIKEHSLRIFVGMPKEAPFNKSHVELSYCDGNAAKWMYLDPVEGSFPVEGTNEAATDTRVLALLGVEPKLGAEFTMTFMVDGTETTQSFVLCGWWEYDPAITASHVLLPKSSVEGIFEELNTQGLDGMTGTWNMDIMLDSTMHIESDLETILENHEYRIGDETTDSTVAIGVNWGYTGAQLSDMIDTGTVIAILALLLIIIFTGYLIIYNVFQISVATDIRFYGLLKTIGTTGRQIKRIIRIQALSLSLIGIPLGLLTGYLIGVQLTPIILKEFNGVQIDTVSASPLIFIASAVFSLITVLISCRKPGKMAARVSPIEAVRYTEARSSKKQLRRASSGVSLPKMAFANLGRNRIKTVITLISLSLAVVLLNMVYTFTNGFDMDKYLKNMVSDFIIADAGYFQVSTLDWNAVDEATIAQINEHGNIADSGRVYGLKIDALQFISEEAYRESLNLNPQETIDHAIESSEKLDGRIAQNVQLFGMEDYALDKLGVVEGNLSRLRNSGSRAIAAVYSTDDYGNVDINSHWAKLGDIITIRYVEEWEYYDAETGEIIDGPLEWSGWYRHAKEYRDVEYEVAARVTVPHAIGYRYYGWDEFVLGSEVFIEDTQSSNVMLYAYDTTQEANTDMEQYLQNLTENVQTMYDYESKQTYAESFDSFRNMFALLGGVLCLIIGLIGILNFLNVILTGILARRREFAVLQAVGMTGKQLIAMLVWEGLFYTLGAALLSAIICTISGPLLSGVMESIFWFFSNHFTILPVLAVTPAFAVLGFALPMLAYHLLVKKSVVERLREE